MIRPDFYRYLPEDLRQEIVKYQRGFNRVSKLDAEYKDLLPSAAVVRITELTKKYEGLTEQITDLKAEAYEVEQELYYLRKHCEEVERLNHPAVRSAPYPTKKLKG